MSNMNAGYAPAVQDPRYQGYDPGAERRGGFNDFNIPDFEFGVPDFVRQFLPHGAVNREETPGVLFNPDHWFNGAPPQGPGEPKVGVGPFVRQFVPHGLVQAHDSGRLYNPDRWFNDEPPKGERPPQYGPPGSEMPPWGERPPQYGPPGSEWPGQEPRPPRPGDWPGQGDAHCGADMACCDMPPPATKPPKGVTPPTGDHCEPAPETPSKGKPPVTQVDQGTPVKKRTYTVVRGDSLSKIAAKYDISWRQLFWANRGKIDHPDLIFPGQVFKIPSSDLKVPHFDYTPMFTGGSSSSSGSSKGKGSGSSSSGSTETPSKGKGTGSTGNSGDDGGDDAPPANAGNKPPAPAPSSTAEQTPPSPPYQDSPSELPPADWKQRG